MEKKKNCSFCGAKLEKDIVALNKKLLGRSLRRQLCIVCLADYLTCTEEDLLVKIEEFKEQGCVMFS